MKILVLSSFLFVTLSVHAQGSNATQVDEFGKIGCDDILARIDNFSIQLHNNPTSGGLVVVSGSNAKLVEKLRMEVLFTSGALQRRGDTSRVRLVRGSETGDTIMSFWLVPPGTNAPVPANAWDMRLPANTKPFSFFADNDVVCMYPTVHKYIKEILAANPKALLNVVINNGKLKELQRLRRETIETYGREYSRRLRFFYVRNRYPDTYREYWIVPKN